VAIFLESPRRSGSDMSPKARSKSHGGWGVGVGGWGVNGGGRGGGRGDWPEIRPGIGDSLFTLMIWGPQSLPK
jgi:hypothetical protein